MKNAETTIGNMLDKQNTVYVSSINDEGFPVTRAMLSPRKRDGISVIYLTTNTSSEKVTQLRSNPKCCVYVCNSRFFRGAVLQGTAEIKEDAHHKEMIWKTGDQMYYPKGVTDPDYCVLKITFTCGQYYSNFNTENFQIPKVL